jgi:hypothetical protein
MLHKLHERCQFFVIISKLNYSAILRQNDENQRAKMLFRIYLARYGTESIQIDYTQLNIYYTSVRALL